MSSLLIELQSFPPISFFIAVLKEGNLLLEASENYVKGSFRNRYHIAGSNGLQRLSIPLSGGKHQQQPIQEVKIAFSDNWQHQHWRSVQAAYGKSPFFIHYEDEIKNQIYSREENLFLWNLNALHLCLELLGLDLSISHTEQYDKIVGNNIRDLRNGISPKNAYSAKEAFIYPQVFSEKNGFISDLSILDLIFCQGPQAGILLEKAAIK